MEWKISDSDLLILDGKCSPDAQKLVNQLKARITLEQDGLTPDEARFIQKILNTAKNEGKLIYRHGSAVVCEVCKTRPGYRPYARGSRTHRKGDPDYSKPLTLQGVEFAEAFVRMSGYFTVGCCNPCHDKLLPHIKGHLAKFLEENQAELPEQLQPETAPAYQRWSARKCEKCGWEGSEQLMGREMTLFGDGTYAATCPICDAKNGLFGNSVKTVRGRYYFTQKA